MWAQVICNLAGTQHAYQLGSVPGVSRAELTLRTKMAVH